MEVAESSDRRDPVHPRCKNVLPQIRPELIHQQDTNRAYNATDSVACTRSNTWFDGLAHPTEGPGTHRLAPSRRAAAADAVDISATSGLR
jgi:hypothetical protein